MRDNDWKDSGKDVPTPEQIQQLWNSAYPHLAVNKTAIITGTKGDMEWNIPCIEGTDEIDEDDWSDYFKRVGKDEDMETIFQRNFNALMKGGNVQSFKNTFPTLYKVIIKSMEDVNKIS